MTLVYADEYWNQKAGIPQKPTAARYRKGYEMLERYEGKLSLHVPF
jgi:hypothetical protein